MTTVNRVTTSVHGQRVYDPRTNRWMVVRPPIWTPPVWMIVARRIGQALGRLGWLAARHPILTTITLTSAWVLLTYGWPTYLTSLAMVAGLLGTWALWHRPSFLRWAGWPAYARWRKAWIYRRHWHAATALTGLASAFGEQVYLPELVRVRCTRTIDVVTVRMTSGQAPEVWQHAASALAHTFGAITCQVRVLKPRLLRLEFERTDALKADVAALSIADAPDLNVLPLGLRSDLAPWTLRLLGNHLLIAGATGAGKGSVLWSLIRAVAAEVHRGTVALWVLDPKGGMELSAGQPMFARFVRRDFGALADLLEEAVTVMQDRAERLAGRTRRHEPSITDPLIVVVIDEMAALTAYCQDREVKRRVAQALGLLLSQGRSVGVLVVGALQDPRKDVLPFRDLFPVRICLRVTESMHVDMVLGDGARNRGALADQIPMTQPGAGYVVLDGDPIPVRVRAAYVADEDITAMATDYAGPHRLSLVKNTEQGDVA